MGECGRIAARENDRRPDAIRRENFLSGPRAAALRPSVHGVLKVLKVFNAPERPDNQLCELLDGQPVPFRSALRRRAPP
ncbi:hypothetical protein OK006_5554 [Actinobacteria bacterium OK006]|nr:hypothetical protein OK006_5554 [Actinobacteria bacterium OK006]